MRRMLASIVAVAVAVAIPAADAHGAAKKKKVAVAPKAKAPKPKAAAPKPKAAAPKPKAPSCGEPGAVQLAVADPLRPFAAARAGKIDAVDLACCASWARAGATWTVVDRLGAPIADAAISTQDDDASTCAEISRSAPGGKKGSGLIVRGAVKPQAPFAPTPAQRAALAKTVASVEKEHVPARSWACLTMPFPVDLRTIAFTVERGDGEPQRWAVVGGEALVVAKLESDGTWSPKLVRATAPDGCHPQAYVARAVFDADGNGRPEIFVHEEVGDAASELVLSIGADDGVRVRSL